MAQCYKCGSDVEVTDRFCMECGTLNPAGQPDSAQALKPTPPTWLPVDGGPSMTIVSPPPATPRSLLSAADAIVCPRCSAKNPKDARFCGDCGEPIGNLPGKLPEAPHQARPAAPVASVLPIPIAPPASEAAGRSAPDLARPVLPPFRASSWAVQPAPESNPPIPASSWAAQPAPESRPPVPASAWAAQPAPDVQLPDHTWTPLDAQPAGAPGQMFWAQSAPPPVNPAGAFPGAPAHPAYAGVSFPQVAPPTRRTHPRGQVITMIVAAIVTVVSATAGVIVQFFLK